MADDQCIFTNDKHSGEDWMTPDNQLSGEHFPLPEDQLSDRNGAISGSNMEMEISEISDDILKEEHGTIFDDLLQQRNGPIPDCQLLSKNMTLPEDPVVEENPPICVSDVLTHDDDLELTTNVTEIEVLNVDIQEDSSQSYTTISQPEALERNKTYSTEQQPANDNMKTEVIPEYLLNSILVQVHKGMKTNYENELLENLSIEPNAFVYPIFENSFEAVVQSTLEMQSYDVNKIREAVYLNSQEQLSEYIDVQSEIVTFHLKIINQIDSVSGPELIRIADKIKTQLISKDSPYEKLKQFLPQISENWLNNYLQELDHIIQSENVNHQEDVHFFLETVNEIYVNHMRSITSKVHLSAQQFNNLHTYLVKAFVDAAKFLDREELKIGDKISEVLKFECMNFKEANRSKLGKLQKVVEQVLMEQKKIYCDEMEEILKNSKDISDLQIRNEEVIKKIEINLKSEIYQQIGINEPCDNYLKTLNISISKYWGNFKDMFNSKLKKHAEELKLHDEEPNKATPQLAPPATSINSKDNNACYKATPINFIVFHLSLSQICVAVPEGDNIQNLGCMSLSLCLTHEGQLKLLSKDVQKELPKGSCVIKTGEYLIQKNDKTIRPKVNFDGKEFDVTTELLLGFLFHSLKQKVERRKEARFQGNIIIVPFWLTSFQRQQIIDAGKLSGFDETYLINENLAIAIYASFKLTETSPDICVISENSDRVDATVYSTSKLEKVLKVAGHCGDYEINNKKSRGERVFEACSKAVNNQTATKFVQGVIKTRKLLVCLSHESADWKQRLHMVKIRLENVGNTYEDCWNRGNILQGAYIYAKNLRHYVKTVREKINSKIFYTVSSKENKKETLVLFSKKDQAQDNSKTNITKPLPVGTNKVGFYQYSEYDNVIFPIGKLEIMTDITEKQKIQLKMRLDHNNVACFLGLNEETSSLKEENDPCSHVWTSSNLNQDQINTLLSIFHRTEIVMSQNTSPSKQNLNEELIQKLNLMATQITNGQGKFRSDVGRGMALDQIKTSVEILTESVNAPAVESQHTFYDNMFHKYFSG